jgi:hypothetical protein
MLTEQNIEAELSYAYLHAVASRGGFSCTPGNRHQDNAAIDAEIHEDGRSLADDSILTSFTVHVQLKATRAAPIEREGRFSYSLPIRQYNKLREMRVGAARILVVLFLPPDPMEWLRHSSEALVAKRCAYWVSLRGAAASENKSDQTVYVPRTQELSISGLTHLMTRCSRQEEILYAP